jgi:hypothetical protein
MRELETSSNVQQRRSHPWMITQPGGRNLALLSPTVSKSPGSLPSRTQRPRLWDALLNRSCATAQVTFRTLRYRMERLGIKGADKDEG